MLRRSRRSEMFRRTWRALGMLVIPQAPPPTLLPSSCLITSLSSAGTHRWRLSTASCTCTRPSESCLLSADRSYCLRLDETRSPLVPRSKMTSLTDDVRRSAMVCILTVPATMTSHDLMKLMAPFNEVMEHMKIIRDSTPNQYMVLIKFCTQVRLVRCRRGNYFCKKVKILN